MKDKMRQTARVLPWQGEVMIRQQQFPNSKDVYAGISINGGGVSHPGTIKGMRVNMVTEIQEAFSADIVTKPAEQQWVSTSNTLFGLGTSPGIQGPFPRNRIRCCLVLPIVRLPRRCSTV